MTDIRTLADWIEEVGVTLCDAASTALHDRKMTDKARREGLLVAAEEARDRLDEILTSEKAS